MDDSEREVFDMGQHARELSGAMQDEMVKRLLLEASESLLVAAKRLRTGLPDPGANRRSAGQRPLPAVGDVVE